MTMTVQRITGTPDEILAEISKAITGGREAMPSGGEELLGLGRKPNERRAAPERPSAETALLTLRNDLLELRRRLLKGASRRETLRDLDYLVDRIDNLLAEM